MAKMFKNIIAPVQVWLLSQGKCVGCSQPLEKGAKLARQDGTQKITCKCKRVYILDKGGKYRRAGINEA